MKNKFGFLILIGYLFTTVALAANITDDTLQVGKPGSSADKSVIFGASNKKKLTHKPSTQTLDYEGNNLTFGDGTNTNKTLKFNKGASSPEIRFNSTTNRLQFSNDASSYKDIGSGSGGSGGENYLQDLNGDFESGTQNWTNSGGTFVASSTSPIAGDQSGIFTASAASQYVESSLITKKLGAGGRTCQAVFEYNWAGTSGQLLAEVRDQTDAIIATSTLNPTTSTQSVVSQVPMFDCDIATQYKVRITSTAASAAFKFDKVFLGYGRSDFQLSQMEYLGYVDYVGTSGATVGASPTDVPSTGFAVTTSGQVQAPLTSIVGVRLQNMLPGTYQFVIVGPATAIDTAGNVSAACGYGLSDTANTFDNDMATNIRTSVPTGTSFDHSISGITFNKSYSTTADRTIRVVMQGVGTGDSCRVGVGGLGTRYRINVYRLPLSPANAVTFETSGWKTSASIPVSFDLGLTTVASNTMPTNASGTISVDAGSIPTYIGCAGTEIATGGTCTGNEGAAISVLIPAAGSYNVCVSGSHSVSDSSGATVGGTTTVFNLAETPNNSQTITQILGDSVVSRMTTNDAAQILTVAHPLTFCRIGNFATAGQKTLRIFYTQTVTGTISANILQSLSWTLYPLSQQFPTPVFTDLQNSLKARVQHGDSGNVAIYGATIANNGSTCTGTNLVGGTWYSSLSRLGTGQCRINFASGFFDGLSVPLCFSTVQGAGGPETRVQSQTAASSDIYTFNSTGTNTDSTFNVVCYGRK